MTPLAIVMVTKDRPRLFEQSIRSLHANTSGPFTLLVVDDCSQDREPIRALSREFGFVVMWNEEPLPLGASKNNALSVTSGELVYLSDNDVFFTPGWDEVLLTAWERKLPEIALLGGGCHPYLRTNRLITSSKGQPISPGRWTLYDQDSLQYHYKDAISGWSWLMKKETWTKFGPLDANALGSGQSEDWAFCQRVKAGGYEVASIWPEVVIHCGITNSEGRPVGGAELFPRPSEVIFE